ncbi:MAG: cellobiose phosphorylase, partial [Acetanaerobacterium sp.]
VDDLTKDVCTQTAVGLFDRYISQSYLDNFLRGGYPLVFPAGGKNHVYHVFSRKHGDLEREYNFFSLEPAYYSQGNGNYRDVAQNRRNDVLLKPAVGDFDVRHFMSLIQADGYNPLHVKGCTFLFDMHAWEQISPLVLSGRAGVKRLLTGSFTPGSLISYVAEHSAELTVSREELLDRVLSHSEQQLEAAFGEGYWSDHWTYLMDLIEAYLSVYPDNRERFLFDDNSYRYFRSPVYVLPRADKYVLVNGRVRQYGAVMEEKDTGADSEQDCWLCDRLGAVYHTNLYAKLVSLALNKFTSLDPCGMGIEMEGGKPGWNDAMNGLPGLFGSGISETAELLRIVDFLIRGAHQYSREIMLPVEMSHLLKRTEDVVDENLSGALSDFECWDRISSAKEDYRLGIRRGINGGEAAYGTEEMAAFFKKLENKLSRGMDKALIYGGGLPPTYFTYEAKAYKLVDGKSNPVNGYPNVVVTAFECRQLPLFLEAPARVLKTVTKPDRARELYDRLRTSDIYDKKLGMYKTSVPLERESPEIGRQKAFTPGWLERESVFLHMEYKYLYAMLKAGLYDEFFADIKTAFVPFMSPEVYGRSTLENCSFIASSVNPDKEVHGRGFVARLSGSTAEVISIWLHMMCGKQVFSFADGELRLSLQPVLPGWLFDENGRVEFMFLGGTRVRYINPNKTDTYGEHGAKPYRYVLTDRHSNTQECVGCITGQLAQMVRDGRIAEIEAYLK